MLDTPTGRAVITMASRLRISIIGMAIVMSQIPVAGGAEKPLGKGFHQLRFAVGDGDAVRCSVWLPKLDAEEPVPMVLALHYGGEVTPYYSMGFLQGLVVPGLKGLGAVIVAPDCPGDGWTDPKSEQVVMALLEYATRTWPIDRNRVVVTGYSMGGIGTWYLASRHPDWFSAAVPIAGRPEGVSDIRVPVYAIHGRRDEVIDVAPTERAIQALRDRDGNAQLVVVKGLTHYDTHRFAQPLSATVEWLRSVWASDP
jgi:predicted peptidase